jgi:hypothetical protein
MAPTIRHSFVSPPKTVTDVAARLPQHRDPVIGENVVDRDDTAGFGQRLRHHDPVPRVAMRAGQHGRGQHVIEGNREHTHVLGRNSADRSPGICGSHPNCCLQAISYPTAALTNMSFSGFVMATPAAWDRRGLDATASPWGAAASPEGRW